MYIYTTNIGFSRRLKLQNRNWCPRCAETIDLCPILSVVARVPEDKSIQRWFFQQHRHGTVT